MIGRMDVVKWLLLPFALLFVYFGLAVLCISEKLGYTGEKQQTEYKTTKLRGTKRRS